jgi:hypothetical protein
VGTAFIAGQRQCHALAAQPRCVVFAFIENFFLRRFFESAGKISLQRRFAPRHAGVGSDRKNRRKGRTVNKLMLTAAAAAAFLCAGFALVVPAKADDWGDRYHRYGYPPQGEKGARWGNMCWVDTSGGGYFGYWAPCTPPRTAKH